MIEQVVKSILQAEDVAKSEISKAEQRAQITISQAHAKVESLTSQAQAANKKLLVDGTVAANIKANKQVSQAIREGQDNVDKEMSRYSGNIDKAVKIVLEHII